MSRFSKVFEQTYTRFLDLQKAEVEGVSGGTLTSMAIADGLIVAAEEHRKALETAEEGPAGPVIKWTLRDFGTGAVIVVGLVIALSQLRGNKIVRIGFQLVLIAYLGLVNGDLLSQAMIVDAAE